MYTKLLVEFGAKMTVVSEIYPGNKFATARAIKRNRVSDCPGLVPPAQKLPGNESREAGQAYYTRGSSSRYHLALFYFYIVRDRACVFYPRSLQVSLFN